MTNMEKISVVALTLMACLVVWLGSDIPVRMSLQDEQLKTLAQFAIMQDARIEALETRLALLEGSSERQGRQMDLVSAASRMGWGQAYRFIREGGLDAE